MTLGLDCSDPYSLFNNPLFSDITIKQTWKGASKEYYAHKAILSINSRWFHNAFTGNFAVRTSIHHGPTISD
jgi:hypothetical protein